jgi:4-hydroxybenzoate polyprenyltransferase
MTVAATRTVPLGTFLRLGRVSNLPTVWSDVLAAIALASGELTSATTAGVLLAMTALYVGGMYLNDAFDREIDARERPSRPIPSGEISPAPVFAVGFGLLFVGSALMLTLGPAAGLAGFALAAAIVAYDLHHKGVSWSPLAMGVCRALVYVGTALAATGTVELALLLGSVALFAHVVGLSYAAKQETFNRIDRMWPLGVLAIPFMIGFLVFPTGPLSLLAGAALLAADALAIGLLKNRTEAQHVPRAVSLMIAAIALVDALMAGAVGSSIAVVLCFAAFALTLVLQRHVPGT